MAKLVARGFFRALMAGELKALLPMCGKQVDFDGASAKDPASIKKQLGAIIKRIKRKGLKLRRIVVLDKKQMKTMFGACPKRLQKSVKKSQAFALARFNRLGAVAFLAKKGRFWRIVALTD